MGNVTVHRNTWNLDVVDQGEATVGKAYLNIGFANPVLVKVTHVDYNMDGELSFVTYRLLNEPTELFIEQNVPGFFAA